MRLAMPGDAESIRRIYNAEVTGSTATFDIEPRDAEAQRDWMERHQGAHPAVVAVASGRVVGFGSLSRYRDRPAYATTVEDSVYVERQVRSGGIGGMLLGQLVTLARDHGFHTVVARIGSSNEASVRLHASCGFEVVGIEREVGRKFGQWLDVTIMQLIL